MILPLLSTHFEKIKVLYCAKRYGRPCNAFLYFRIAHETLIQMKSDFEKTNVIPENTEILYASVHVRRGDYLEHLQKLYNTTYFQNEYFEKAFEYLERKYFQVQYSFLII